MLTGDDSLARALVRDVRQADLEEPDRAMLECTLKLTRDRAGVESGDVEALREEFDEARRGRAPTAGVGEAGETRLDRETRS